MLKKSGEVRKSSGVLGELEEEVGLLAAFGLLSSSMRANLD